MLHLPLTGNNIYYSLQPDIRFLSPSLYFCFCLPLSLRLSFINSLYLNCVYSVYTVNVFCSKHMVYSYTQDMFHTFAYESVNRATVSNKYYFSKIVVYYRVPVFAGRKFIFVCSLTAMSTQRLFSVPTSTQPTYAMRADYSRISLYFIQITVRNASGRSKALVNEDGSTRS